MEAPYRKVKKIYDENGNLKEQVVTDEVEYMTADVEDEYVVAQANEPLDEGKHFIRPRVSARRRDEILEIDAEKVDYMDVSPRMMVSVATACIPFLENDDCNRALMGSNMQRQAVPLMVTQQPIVATGMEYKAATDSGTAVLAKNDGIVEKMDADHVVVRNNKGELEDYPSGQVRTLQPQAPASTSVPSWRSARASRPVRCWPTALQCATANFSG